MVKVTEFSYVEISLEILTDLYRLSPLLFLLLLRAGRVPIKTGRVYYKKEANTSPRYFIKIKRTLFLLSCIIYFARPNLKYQSSLMNDMFARFVQNTPLTDEQSIGR